MVNYIVALFSSLLGKILLLREHAEKKDSNIREFFTTNLMVVVIVDILLAVGLTFVQFKTTNTMNIPTAVELGIAAPLILTKTIKVITGRNN